jgi:hypothetical protein
MSEKAELSVFPAAWQSHGQKAGVPVGRSILGSQEALADANGLRGAARAERFSRREMRRLTSAVLFGNSLICLKTGENLVGVFGVFDRLSRKTT